MSSTFTGVGMRTIKETTKIIEKKKYVLGDYLKEYGLGDLEGRFTLVSDPLILDQADLSSFG